MLYKIKEKLSKLNEEIDNYNNEIEELIKIKLLSSKFKDVIEQENDKIIFTFRGNGFLRYQIRNMVGILIRVGENKILPEKIEEIIESKDRTKSGKTAPSEGLYLTNIEY